MSNPVGVFPRIPNRDDWRSERCGHNFLPLECPYEFCGYRDTLIGLQRLIEAISAAALREKQDGLDAEIGPPPGP